MATAICTDLDKRPNMSRTPTMPFRSLSGLLPSNIGRSRVVILFTILLRFTLSGLRVSCLSIPAF